MSVVAGFAFWAIAALITAGAVGVLVTPLMRRRAPAAARAGYDLAVYRDQLAEIEREVAQGLLSADQAAAARTEIARRMLAVAGEAEDPAAVVVRGGKTPRAPRRLAMALVVLVPAASLALYLSVGDPEIVGRRAEKPDAAAAEPSAEVRQAIQHLAEQLAKSPDDLQGWLLLGQAYARMGRYAEGAEAFRHAAHLAPADAEIAAALGETLTLGNGGTVSEEARQAFAAALAADARSPRARYYLALARAEAGDLRGALDGWTALAAEAPADAPWLPAVKGRIAEAARTLGVDVATLDPQAKPAAPRTEPAGAQAGSGGALRGPTAADIAAAQEMTPDARAAMIRGMVEGLAARLKSNPGDVDGWLRLAHAYRVLGDPDQETAALENAAGHAPDRADVQLAYADALYRTAPDRAPAPTLLTALRGALAEHPNEPAALWFLGLDAATAKRPVEAAELWGRLLGQLDPASPEHADLRARLEALRQGG